MFGWRHRTSPEQQQDLRHRKGHVRWSPESQLLLNLPNSTFAEMPKLIDLDLSYNSIITPPSGAVSGLDCLNALILDNNKIVDFQPNTSWDQ